MPDRDTQSSLDDTGCNDVIEPIHISTTFCTNPFINDTHSTYARFGSPNSSILEHSLAVLENATHCKVFSSGMGGISAVLELLLPGDHVVCSNELYGGVTEYMNTFFTKITSGDKEFLNLQEHDLQIKKPLQNHTITFTVTEFVPHKLRKAILKNTKMIYFEPCTNPLLTIIDVRMVVAIAKAANPDILVVTDNTFMTPLFLKPLTIGVDIVIHSATKYLNGHSDLLMGAVLTNNKKIANAMETTARLRGAVPSAFDCFLLNRSLKTFTLRMMRHQQNSIDVVRFLSSHKAVSAVFSPHMNNHPTVSIHASQSTGFGGMVSFRLSGSVEQFIKSLRVFSVAFSLGGVESLAEIPFFMSHKNVSTLEKESVGITKDLIRLSVGCEDIDEILNDLQNALSQADAVTT